jgi:hypothetical protein
MSLMHSFLSYPPPRFGSVCADGAIRPHHQSCAFFRDAPFDSYSHTRQEPAQWVSDDSCPYNLFIILFGEQKGREQTAFDAEVCAGDARCLPGGTLMNGDEKFMSLDLVAGRRCISVEGDPVESGRAGGAEALRLCAGARQRRLVGARKGDLLC